MSGTAFVLLSGALTFGIPLLLAVRELYQLKRRGHGGWDGDGPAPIVPPKPPSFGHKPLPDCLIPRLPPAQRGAHRSTGPVRLRELEKA